MKNILIISYGMGCGGAEKSLISFLNRLPQKKWNIDLLIANPNGMYMKQIPDTVHLLENQYELENFATPLKLRRKKICNINDLVNQIRWQVGSKFLYKDLSRDEKRWELWGKFLHTSDKKYDLAISYMNGPTNYYVIDKIEATKKVLWIHNEYQKLRYNVEFDRPYYESCDRIITISQKCLESFVEVFPTLKNKISILENITIKKDILNLGNDGVAVEFEERNRVKLLSVGRLGEQKGFDLAIKSAKVLKDRGVGFIWIILGEGPDRKKLQEQIDADEINNNVKLIGIRSNPYVYIKKCDIFVQTSCCNCISNS